MASKWLVPMALGLVPACTEPLGPPPAAVVPQLTIEPFDAEGAGPAPRLRLAKNGGVGVRPDDLSLWEGELTDSQLARVRRRDVPSTLAPREVPALGWLDASTGDVLVRPTRFLAAATSYTVVSASFGRLGVFDVRSGDPRLERRWPPTGEAGAGLAVVCGPSAPAGSWALGLDPSLAPAELETDYGLLDGSSCAAVHFAEDSGDFDDFGGSGEVTMLPPEIEAHALDPEPFTPVDAAPSLAGACDALRVGPLCARIEDDRLTFENAGDALLLRAFLGEVAELSLIGAGAHGVLRGFAPDSEQRLLGEVVTRSGHVEGFDVAFHTAPARPRWVINEVLANPLGREPAEEWIELVNRSSVEAELAGLVLEDSAGRIELPAFAAAPGEHFLLVREDFAGTGQDVAPPVSVRLVRLPELAKNGLSNSGEALRLVGANGAMLSAFPALEGRHAGVSLARRTLDSPDDDSAGFAEHAAPGASPGSVNQLVQAD